MFLNASILISSAPALGVFVLVLIVSTISCSLVFYVEQSGTYFESTLRNPETTKNGQRRVDLHIRISKENYIFLKENFRHRFSNYKQTAGLSGLETLPE